MHAGPGRDCDAWFLAATWGNKIDFCPLRDSRPQLAEKEKLDGPEQALAASKRARAIK